MLPSSLAVVSLPNVVANWCHKSTPSAACGFQCTTVTTRRRHTVPRLALITLCAVLAQQTSSDSVCVCVCVFVRIRARARILLRFRIFFASVAVQCIKRIKRQPHDWRQQLLPPAAVRARAAGEKCCTAAQRESRCPRALWQRWRRRRRWRCGQQRHQHG